MLREDTIIIHYQNNNNNSNNNTLGEQNFQQSADLHWSNHTVAMVHMDSISDEEELNSHDSTQSDNFASHDTSDSNSIILYPFAHQVGGHTQLLTFDKSTLCKPLIPRELLFYLNVPKELVNFVPSYKGVVQIRETGQGTYPSVVYQPLRSPKSPYAKYRPHGSTHLHAGYHSEDDDDSRQSVTDSCDRSPFELHVQIRPFSDEKVLKKNLSQENLLRADYISRPNEKYLLLLENVASKYQLPCILDLKMGTRQHGDDATEEKRHRQIAKCQASTSASLGVRLCGMQVYQVDYGGFLWYDKYYGRKVDEDGLKRALHQYFQNGTQLNEDIIDDVISRLKLLSNAVEKSPSFRFYGTSLLIIHEGCTSNNNLSTKNSNKRCPVDVRLIDFAHTICDYTNTNGRSSSSPSVLTKSSSAEQLSSCNPILTTNPEQVAATAAELGKTTLPEVVDSGDAPMIDGKQIAAAAAAAVTIGLSTKAVVKQAGQVANEEATSLEAISAETGKSHFYSPTSPSRHTTVRQDELDAANIINNNNNSNNNNNIIISTKDNNNGSNNALSKSSTKPTITQKYQQSQNRHPFRNQQHHNHNHHHHHHLETLREVDHQTSNPELLVGQELSAASTTPSTQVAPTESSANTASTTTTTVSKQISNASLGGRRISKTSMGPDKGLLFGLENLMRLLDDLKSETLITTC